MKISDTCRNVSCILALAVLASCGDSPDKPADAPAGKPAPVAAKTAQPDPAKQAMAESMLQNANIPVKDAVAFAKAHNVRLNPRVVDEKTRWEKANPDRPHYYGGQEFMQDYGSAWSAGSAGTPPSTR